VTSKMISQQDRIVEALVTIFDNIIDGGNRCKTVQSNLLPGHNHSGVVVLSCGNTKSSFGSSMPDLDSSSSASFLSNSKRTFLRKILSQLEKFSKSFLFQQNL